MSNISAETSVWISLSLNFTHYLGGQRLVCEHRPCPRWQMLLGDWRWQRKHLLVWTIRNAFSMFAQIKSYILWDEKQWEWGFPLPWFHENTTKMDLSMKINIQHLFKVVLKRKHLKNTRKPIKKMLFCTVHTSKTRFKLGFKYGS